MIRSLVALIQLDRRLSIQLNQRAPVRRSRMRPHDACSVRRPCRRRIIVP